MNTPYVYIHILFVICKTVSFLLKLIEKLSVKRLRNSKQNSEWNDICIESIRYTYYPWV